MEKLFKMDVHGTNIRRETVAGITTFLAMAYILAVNPSIMSNAGMNSASVFTGTAIAAAIATLTMAFTANLPPYASVSSEPSYGSTSYTLGPSVPVS